MGPVIVHVDSLGATAVQVRLPPEWVGISRMVAQGYALSVVRAATMYHEWQLTHVSTEHQTGDLIVKFTKERPR